MTSKNSDSTLLARFALPRLIAVALPFAVVGVHAQTIDEVTLVQRGPDVVARVVFNGTVRFMQQAPVSAAQLLRVDFELVAADERVVSQVIEESRQVRGVGGVPDFTVSYVATPRSRVKQLTLQLSQATMITARQGTNSRTIELLFAGAAAPSAAAMPGVPHALTSSTSIAPASERRFAVTLQTVPLNALDTMLPVPVQFQAYDAFSVDVVRDGVASVQVNLGYFETEEQAQKVRTQALTRFPQAAVLDLVRRREEVLQAASALARAAPVVTLQKPPPQAASTPATTAPLEPASPAQAASSAPAAGPVTEVEQRAAELMNKSRQALTEKRYETAVNLLNQLLLLPPNAASQEAQELIGVAWERAGDVARARIEYQLYLKLFPQGEGAERVSQRLASLEGGAPLPAAATAAAATARAAVPKTFTGSIAQYYYGGVARSQSLVNLAAGIDQQTLSKTTQSAIVTSADLNARYVQTDAETRVVLRGTGSTNLSALSHNESLLGTAYVDYRRTDSGLGLRAGRQSAISGGLLGLFDGVSVVYPVRSGLKVDVMGGAPANTLVSAPAQRLVAAMIEADGIFDKWGGNAYIVDQSSQGITNRRAIGAELRYSAERFSMYSLLDYDINFKALNGVSLQGSFQAPAQTTVTVLVDDRKAPSLELTNALISSGATSLKTLLQTQSLAQVRAAALATSASARQGQLSVSRPLNERWQLGVDLRYSQIGALPAVGNFEATPATGAQYGVSSQLTGSNLYSSRDLSAFGLSVMTAPQFKGVQVSYNNLTGLRNNDLTFEPSIRLYSQHDNQGIRLTRVSPGLRLSYRMSRRASLLGESMIEYSTTTGPSGHSSTSSAFFYLGYRYEFN